MTTAVLTEQPQAVESKDQHSPATHGESTSVRCASRKPRNISELERWSSAGVGSVLLLDCLTGNRGWWSGLLGAALVHRGVTGHCMGYALLGLDTADHNSA